MRIDLPQNVNFIIDTLYEHGFEAYAVGGCVRDSLLGRTPQDWDITTSAKPAQVKAIFDHTIDTGIQHGTVTVMLEHVGYEVTTYRIDGEYEDARHPKEVTFTSNLKLDLERRDFTINAMAYNHRMGLVDEFDGIGDLKAHVIRCVGCHRAQASSHLYNLSPQIRFPKAPALQPSHTRMVKQPLLVNQIIFPVSWIASCFHCITHLFYHGLYNYSS